MATVLATGPKNGSKVDSKNGSKTDSETGAALVKLPRVPCELMLLVPAGVVSEAQESESQGAPSTAALLAKAGVVVAVVALDVLAAEGVVAEVVSVVTAEVLAATMIVLSCFDVPVEVGGEDDLVDLLVTEEKLAVIVV